MQPPRVMAASGCNVTLLSSCKRAQRVKLRHVRLEEIAVARVQVKSQLLRAAHAREVWSEQRQDLGRLTLELGPEQLRRYQQHGAQRLALCARDQLAAQLLEVEQLFGCGRVAGREPLAMGLLAECHRIASRLVADGAGFAERVADLRRHDRRTCALCSNYARHAGSVFRSRFGPAFSSAFLAPSLEPVGRGSASAAIRCNSSKSCGSGV